MIKLDATYSDYVNTSDPKYPAGKAVDASGEENTDGTPLLAKWMNDINGTRQAIIKEAFGDMSSVSGIPDDAENSDVLKALKKITQEYTNGKVANEAQARAQGDTDALSSAKSYVDQKFIKHYQKGYLQMPGMPSPLEDTSMHYEGYSWYEVNYDGNFFRAKGRNAKMFSSKKLTKEQIKNGNYIFQDEEQEDAIRNIKGGDILIAKWWCSNSVVGCLKTEKRYSYYGPVGDEFDTSDTFLSFDASRVVPTAEENRPRNLTFIYWILVKNE
nr:hypothetical protein [Treponema denticola]